MLLSHAATLLTGTWVLTGADGAAAGASNMCLNYTTPRGHQGKVNVTWKAEGAVINSTYLTSFNPGTNDPLRLRISSNDAGGLFAVDHLSQNGVCGSAGYTREYLFWGMKIFMSFCLLEYY